jgi:hypothetical protein
MSIASDIFATGLAELATVHGHSVSYCATYGGTYVALPGFLLIQQRPVPHSQDEAHGMEVQLLGAVLKGPLTPAMVDGYFIKDVNSGQIYSCRKPKLEAQQIANLEVATPQVFGPDRDGAR